MSTRWALITISLLTLGCSGEPTHDRPLEVEPDIKAPATVIEPSASSEPATAPATEAAPEPTPEPASEAKRERLSRAQRAEVSRALARGRKAAKDKDWATAPERFLAGIAIDSEHAQLHCEAGWAAYMLEDPRARELLSAGVVLSHDEPRLRATCLHNLGRWYERAGQTEEAIAYYADSLALRPDNGVTRSRYRKLSGQDPALVAVDCPPAGRFADVEAFCQALLAQEPPEHEAECGTRDLDAPVIGPALGEIVRVEVDHGGPYWTNYLLVRLGDELEVLGRLGTSVGRSCSIGYTEIERVRWLDGGRLIFELHRSGEYSCHDTPYMNCVYEAENDGKPTSICDGVSDVWEPEITDDHPRMLCARIDGSFRCSSPPEFYSDPLDPASKLAKVPEGASFDALLVCPPVLRSAL